MERKKDFWERKISKWNSDKERGFNAKKNLINKIYIYTPESDKMYKFLDHTN